MKKKNHFKSLSLKYSYWLIAFGIVCVGYNSITVKGVDLISNAVDQMLAGSKVLMGPLLSKLIIMIIGGTVLAFLRKCCNRMYSLNIETDIKNKSVTHIETLAYSYFDQAGTGSILTKLSTDMREVEGLFSNMIPAGISETITALIIGSYFFNISKILLLGVLIIYPAVFGMTKILSNKYRSLERHKRKKMDFITEIIQDSLGGIAIIKSYNLFEPLKERLNQAADAVVENEKERTKLAATMGYVMGITRWVPIILCCSIALHECIKGKMSVGEVMSFTILLDQFVIAMSELPIIFTGIQEKRVPLERINDILNVEPELSGTYIGKDHKKEQAIIALKDIHFAYPSATERKILKGVDLKIEAGKTTAIVGSSGGGKTTLFKLFTGFYKPTSGEYLLNGIAFKDWQIQAAREQFALVSQNVFLFPLTIAENITYGKEGVTQEEIERVCKLANIHDFIIKLPQGYRTLVGERGIKLSGGERQRISIARAFLKEAPILLLDEPTSAIDTETEAMIQEAIERVSNGRTVIIIAHRLSTIEHADKIIVLDEGKVAEQGTHTELLQKGGVYTALYQRGQQEEEVAVGEAN